MKLFCVKSDVNQLNSMAYIIQRQFCSVSKAWNSVAFSTLCCTLQNRTSHGSPLVITHFVFGYL